MAPAFHATICTVQYGTGHSSFTNSTYEFPLCVVVPHVLFIDLWFHDSQWPFCPNTTRHCGVWTPFFAAYKSYLDLSFFVILQGFWSSERHTTVRTGTVLLPEVVGRVISNRYLCLPVPVPIRTELCVLSHNVFCTNVKVRYRFVHEQERERSLLRSKFDSAHLRVSMIRRSTILSTFSLTSTLTCTV